MADTVMTEVLRIEAQIDPRRLIKDLKKVDKQITFSLKNIVTNTKKLDKVQKQFYAASQADSQDHVKGLQDVQKGTKVLGNQVEQVQKESKKLKEELQGATGAAKGLAESSKKIKQSAKDVSDSMQDLAKVPKDLFRTIKQESEEYQKDMAKSVEYTSRLTKEIKDSSDQIAALKKGMAGAESDAHRESIEKIVEERKARLESLQDAKEKLSAMTSEVQKVRVEAVLEEAGKTGTLIAEPFKALAQKDLPGVFKAGGVAVGVGIAKAFSIAGRKLERQQLGMKQKGAGLMQRGAALRAEGKAGGGLLKSAKGAGLEAIGSGLKGLGSMAGTLGPLIKTLGTLGPILGVVGGSLAAVVKLFIDAEAQAKEFQKELLQSASTGEFLAKAGGDADVAFEDLKDTVTSIRNSAFDLMDWGITNKEHLAFRNTLTQEGVSINRMADEFKKAKEQGKAAGGAVQYFAQQTATAVAFSRQFGVALADVTQLQGEMMSELGVSLDNVTESFTYMAQVASSSGIAMNKFFAIMRGVSSDLTLYNMRMEDAVTLLGKLGKVMSPRNADKFMRSISRGFKDMDIMDRVKMTLLAGQDKTKKIVEEDIKRREENLTKAIAKRLGKEGATDVEAIRKAVSEDKAGKGKALRTMLKGVEGGGALREESLALRQMNKTSKRGLFGLAQSVKDLSIKGTMEMTKAAVMRFAAPGTETLGEAVAQMGPALMAKNMNVSEEQIDALVKLETATIEMKEDLLSSGNKTQAEIDSMSDEDMLRELGMTKEQLEKSLGSQKDFAQKQTELTNSMMDKLQVLIDFLMNQFYNSVMDIYEGLLDILAAMHVGSADERTAKKAKVAAARTRDPEIIKLVAAAGKDPWKARSAILETSLGKAFSNAVTGTSISEKQGKLAEIKVKLDDKSLTETQRESLKKEAVLLEGQVKAQKVAYGAINEQVAVRGSGEIQAIKDAFAMAEVGQVTYDPRGERPENEGAKKVLELMESGGLSFSDAMEKAGLTTDQVSKVMGKMFWSLDATKVTKSVADFANNADFAAKASAKKADADKEGAKSAEEKAEADKKTQAENFEAAKKMLAGVHATVAKPVGKGKGRKTKEAGPTVEVKPPTVEVKPPETPKTTAATGLAGKAAPVSEDAMSTLMASSVDRISEAVGKFGAEMVAGAMGISEDQLKAMTKLESSLETQNVGVTHAQLDALTNLEKSTVVAPIDIQGPPLPEPPALAPKVPIDIQGPPLPDDEEAVDLAKEQAGTLDGIYKALRIKGIKIDKAFLKNQLGTQIENSVLDAERVALFEYWLYSELDRDKTLAAMKDKGITAKGVGSYYAGKALEHGKTDPSILGGEAKATEGAPAAAPAAAPTTPANAKGGYVQRIDPTSNRAIFSPLPPAAPGEGWGSIGPGETILPAGAGGGGGGKTAGTQRMDLNLKVDVTGSLGPDFPNYLKVAVTNMIYDYERRKKL